jgi:hypothetical protein
MLEPAILASEHGQAHGRVGDESEKVEWMEASEMQDESSGRNHRMYGQSKYIAYNEASLRHI